MGVLTPFWGRETRKKLGMGKRTERKEDGGKKGNFFIERKIKGIRKQISKCVETEGLWGQVGGGRKEAELETTGKPQRQNCGGEGEAEAEPKTKKEEKVFCV